MANINAKVVKRKDENAMINNNNGRKFCKYTWTAKEMDLYYKNQAEELKKLGFNISPAGISRLLYNKLIIPNDIKMKDLIKPKLKVKNKWTKNPIF